MQKTFALATVLFSIFWIPTTVFADEAKLWQALRTGGHIVLIRHALAPGIGDPENFEVGNCSTQRNLSDEGRDQARRIGDRFRANGIDRAAVFNSQWCRCRETAKLLGLGETTDLPVLNSFYQHAGQRGPQTRGLSQWLADHALERPLVLVTHQVNISAFTGTYASSGEMVIVRREAGGDVVVVGTIETD